MLLMLTLAQYFVVLMFFTINTKTEVGIVGENEKKMTFATFLVI